MTTQRIRTCLACATAIGALALSGCSSDDGGAAAASSTSPASSSATTSTPAPATAGPGPDADLATATFPVDLDQALSVAEQAVPGGTVTKIELEFDRTANAWVWKIDSQQNTDQHEIKVDAVSARVIADDRDQESANPRAVDPRKLTPKDALGRATALVPGSVAEWALEWDDGVQRYTVDVRTSGTDTQDVAVDVDTGMATRK